MGRTSELTFLGVFAQAQAYVRCVDLGLTVFDLPEPARAARPRAMAAGTGVAGAVFDGPAPVPTLQPPRPATSPRPRPPHACHAPDEVPASPPARHRPS